MARGKTITTQSLVALGAGPLADLLIEQAELDPGLRKKLAMLLAAAQGGGKLADEIDKRLRTIARSRSYLDWEKAKALVRELDHLRGAIASRLAETDHTRAVEMLWTFIAMADQVTRRVGERGALAEAVFDAAMVDLGRISAAAPPPDRAALARRVLASSDSDDLGLGDVFIRHMSEALGPDGRAEIGRAAESAGLRSLDGQQYGNTQGLSRVSPASSNLSPGRA